MSRLAVVGLSHKSAGVEARQRLARLPVAAVLERLRAEGFAEAVVLSTCNRFEIYFCEERSRLQGWETELLARIVGASLDGQTYALADRDAVGHLFNVAAGLDSLVVGETEILGQVKNAYEAAKAAGLTGKRTNVLFQRALYTGKKVRSQTSIAVGQTSVASVAVQLAETIFGSLSSCEVLILGAGAMAELTARHLLGKKIKRLTISNRTWERGKALADQFAASALPWESFESFLSAVDIVVASTGSSEPILRRHAVEAAAKRRLGRSLFIIDIAMPRDVEESVDALEHVYVYHLENLKAIADENLRARASEIARAQALALEKSQELWLWLSSLASGQELSLKHSGGKAP